MQRGNVLRDDGPNAIVCTVRPDRVEVSCNGKGLIAWHGDPRTFSLPHDAMMPNDRRLFLRSWDKPFRVTRIELSAPAAAAPQKAPAGDKRRSLGDLLDDPAPDARLEVPAPAPLATADKKVADKFEPQWKAAKQHSDRVGVARKLYEAGLATTEDPVLRYALLCEASRRAAGLGDAGIACDAIDQLGREYKIDALADKLAAASDALVKAHSAPQNWTLALVALLLCDRAMNDERYEEARKFAALAAAAGRRTRNHELKTYSERRLSGVRNRQQQQEQFEQAITQLKDDPDDAAANLAAGIDLCLFQGDWRRGLPRLARSAIPCWSRSQSWRPKPEEIRPDAPRWSMPGWPKPNSKPASCAPSVNCRPGIGSTAACLTTRSRPNGRESKPCSRSSSGPWQSAERG